MKAAFLYNKQSGRGRIAERVEAIRAVFARHGYELELLPVDFNKNPFEGREAIELMVVAGGDGTVNFTVNAMRAKGLDIPLGIIPAGTANDFAGALGMSHDPLEAARQIATGEEMRVDCGCANGLHFINIFSFGLFTTTSQRTPDERKHKLGKLAYLLEGAKELRTMHAVPLQVDADGERFEFDALMALVFNGETAGGFRLARQSSVRDGLFDVIMLEKKNFFRSVFAMLCYLSGGHPRIVRHLRARKIELASTVDEPTDVDGQPGVAFPLRIECLAGAVRVRQPRRP